MRIIFKMNWQALFSACLVALTACTAPKPPPSQLPVTEQTDGGTTRAAVLGMVGACALKNASDFKVAADALGAQPSPDTWREAMKRWQRVELLQLGPTGSSAAPGGMDLRDQIYSWPLVSRCGVDQVLATKGWERGVSSLLVNRRGLAALEVLLFAPPDTLTCSQDVWSTLDATERSARRRAYTQAVADDVKALAVTHLEAWSAGFVDTLRTAGPGNAVYMSQQGAMNRVSDALFYVEKELKNAKLAVPIGLRECAAPPCVDAVESPLARHSTENLRQNLSGFRALFEGCADGRDGFDDLLIGLSAESLATRMRERLIAAQAALEAIEEPDLAAALTADPASVRALYDAVKAVTDLLKSEFITVLDLELPMGLEGDND